MITKEKRDVIIWMLLLLKKKKRKKTGQKDPRSFDVVSIEMSFSSYSFLKSIASRLASSSFADQFHKRRHVEFTAETQ
jgi:hypothetical protein